MGVQDRDWWRKRKDNLHPDDPRSWPVGDKSLRKAKSTRTGSYDSSPSWLVVVIVAIVVLGSFYLLDRYRSVITGALKTSSATHLLSSA